MRPPETPVYPRLCGGTLVAVDAAARNAGLSPPVRGNPCMAADPGHGRRSIPACAGEPRIAQVISAADRVYPRLCGGTPR